MNPAWSALAAFCLVLASALAGAAPADAPTDQPTGTEILPLHKVRIGMKGYGRTVFQGTRVESFAVEVLSVVRDFGPKRGVIWVRCPEERMRQSGPVAGMSGSPIYIWGDDEPHVMGRGGRLIGAFAFGYPASKECYVGVQPIEYMIDVGTRAQLAEGIPADQTTTTMKPGGGAAGEALYTLLQIADAHGLAPDHTWRAQALSRLFKQHLPASTGFSAPIHRPDGLEGRPVRMLLPMAVDHPVLAGALAPLFAPMGMVPIGLAAAPVAGKPPVWIDPDSVPLEPGGVLSIPFAYGDLDLSVSGTVTEVLPNGRVLAFGHSLGPLWADTALPMATGYVHFILSTGVGAFKVGGSAVIRGAIVRSEVSAVAGLPGAGFSVAPVSVAVNMPSQPPQTYQYDVVHHRRLTPLITAMVAAISLEAVQSLPVENTVRLHGTIQFGGKRRLEMDRLMPLASAFGLLFALYPPMMVMSDNPFEPVPLESVQLTIDVFEDVRYGSIIHGWLDHEEVAPGDELALTVRIQKYGEPPFEKRVEFAIPDTVPEGNYELVVCDARQYATRLFANRPHLLSVTNIDELFSVVRRINDVSSQAFYVVMNLPEKSLAMGRNELPKLPSSRQALLAPPTSTLATLYREWVSPLKVDMGFVVQGNMKFNIVVNDAL